MAWERCQWPGNLVPGSQAIYSWALAKGMFQQQVVNGWPGLTEEATRICNEIGLPDVCQEDVTKDEIKEAILNHHHADLKREMRGKEKCMELMMVDLRTPQSYLASTCLAEARMGARVQVRMIKCPGNMPGLYRRRMECETCEPWREVGEQPPISSQDHLRTCRAYQFLQREHKDMDIDFNVLTKYFMDLMWIRA